MLSRKLNIERYLRSPTEALFVDSIELIRPCLGLIDRQQRPRGEETSPVLMEVETDPTLMGEILWKCSPQRNFHRHSTTPQARARKKCH